MVVKKDEKLYSFLINLVTKLHETVSNSVQEFIPISDKIMMIILNEPVNMNLVQIFAQYRTKKMKSITFTKT